MLQFMQIFTSLVLAAFGGYIGAWYFGAIEGNFALLLFLATVVTGAYWLAERFYFLPEYIAELQALDMRGRPPAGPELAIIAKGDEVLDWREMAGRYPQARQIVQEGGDHALGKFAEYLPLVDQFLGLA